MAVSLSALCAVRALPQENSRYSFLLQDESTPGPSAAGKIRTNDKSNALIVNRTCALPACSTVPHTNDRES
jgi:hypothetical protein